MEQKFNNELKRKIIERDGRRCCMCGKHEYFCVIHVHHLDWNHDNNVTSNLITLCRECHINIHNDDDKIVYTDVKFEETHKDILYDYDKEFPKIEGMMPEFIETVNKYSKDNRYIVDTLKNKLKPFERDIITECLNYHCGNRKDTAKSLDINRTTLYNKMKEYNLF